MSMIVHFICHLDCATKYPGIWWNIILGVSVRVFLDEMIDLVKQIVLPNVNGPHPISRRLE